MLSGATGLCVILYSGSYRSAVRSSLLYLSPTDDCVSVLAAKNVQPADLDRVLVQMLEDDDDRALEELLRKEGAKILRLIQRLTGWHADSHDLCQEVFIAAWRHGSRLDTDQALARWLTRVATNRCRSWHRRRVLSDRLFHWLRNDTSRQVVQGDAGQIVDRDWVRHALALLKPRDREVLVLRYMEHLEIDEIARILGIKRSAVDTRLTRARNRLSHILDDRDHRP